MDVAVTGASGLIGSALTDALTTDGHRVLRITRRTDRVPDTITWDPAAGTIDSEGLEGIEALVHLAGAPIGRPHWSKAHKVSVLDSRVDGTALISTTLASLRHPPNVLISASAVGYYGDRGDEIVTEASPAGTGFLANVCQLWEAATRAADDGVK